MSKPIKRGDEQTFDEVDEQIVKNFFFTVGDAVRRKDREALERVFADEYTFISPRGSFHNKELMVACLVEPDENELPADDFPIEEQPFFPDKSASQSVRQPKRPSGTSIWFIEPQFDMFRVVEEKLLAFGNTALKTGKITVEGKHRDRVVTGNYLFANVFVKRNSQWQIAATHMTRLTV